MTAAPAGGGPADGAGGGRLRVLAAAFLVVALATPGATSLDLLRGEAVAASPPAFGPPSDGGSDPTACPDQGTPSCPSPGGGNLDCSQAPRSRTDGDGDGVPDTADGDDDCDRIADGLENRLDYLDPADNDTDDDGLADPADLHPSNDNATYDLTIQAVTFREEVAKDCCLWQPGDPYLTNAEFRNDRHGSSVSFRLPGLSPGDHKDDGHPDARRCPDADRYCYVYRYGNASRTAVEDVFPQDPRADVYDRRRDGSPLFYLSLPASDADVVLPDDSYAVA